MALVEDAGWAALQVDADASLLPHVRSFRTAASPECVQFHDISPPSVFPFSSSLSPCHPGGCSFHPSRLCPSFAP